MRVVSTYRVFSQTSDEGIHIAAGYDLVRNHSWWTDIHHPPLARFFFGLAVIGLPQPHASDRDTRGNELLFSNDHYIANLARARAGNLALLLLGIVFVARWAMRLFSPAVGLVAGALFAMLPPILAHGGLATTDMAVAAMFPFALDETGRLLEAPTLRRGLMIGFAVALGVLSKYSFFVFYPFAALVLWVVSRRFNRRIVLCALIGVVVAIIVVWLAFGCSFKPLVAGIEDVRKHNSGGHRNFLFEQLSWAGWWYYFPVALFFKTPIPFLILAIAGCALLIRERLEIPLIAIVILLVVMPSHINIGIRHILPIYAPLAIAAAAAFARLRTVEEASSSGAPAKAGEKPRPAKAGAPSDTKKSLIVALFRMGGVLLVLWLFADGVAAHPDYLPWFNGFAAHPETVLNDSNLDWGQDVLRLVRYTREHRIGPISLLLFTSTDLDRIGFGPHKVIRQVEPIHGWLAISEMEIAIGKTHSDRVRLWLDSLIGGKPYTRIGKTIRLYRL